MGTTLLFAPAVPLRRARAPVRVAARAQTTRRPDRTRRAQTTRRPDRTRRAPLHSAALHAPPPPKLADAEDDAAARLTVAEARLPDDAGLSLESTEATKPSFSDLPIEAALQTGATLAGLTAVFLVLDQTGLLPGQDSGVLTDALIDFVVGPRFLVSLGLGVSAFLQALTGFGFAIVSVAALSQIDWISHSSIFDTVQPVTATLGAMCGWALLLPEAKRINWPTIRTLLLATTLGTPLGALLVEHVDATIVIRGLGAVITGYVMYALAGIPVPKWLGDKKGAWGLGVLAGALGGAFDITGPPLVVHGEAAKWDAASFRRNILAVVSINSSFVVLWDMLNGKLDDFYYLDFLKYAAPSVVVCLFLGKYVATRLDPAVFKKIVLGTCAVLGAKLMLS